MIDSGVAGTGLSRRRGARVARALACGLAAASAIFAVVVFALAERVPDIVETPITISEPAALIPQFSSIPVELSADPAAGASVVRSDRLTLAVGDPSRLLQSNAIELLVTRYFTNPRVVKTELLVPAAGCAFQSPPGASEFPSNALLLLHRLGECRPVSAPLQLELVVTYEGVGHFAVWAYEPRAGVGHPGAITAGGAAYPAGTAAPPLRGYYADDRGLSALRRVDLLSYLWLGRVDAGTVWRDVLAAWLLVAIGIAFLVDGRERLRAAIGTGLVAGGLALAYQVIVPPFQAPDEPTHLWGYARLTGDTALEADIEPLIKRTHFTRLRFWRFERFRPFDTTRPSDVGWLDTAIQESHRSGTFPTLARIVRAAVPSGSGATTLRIWRRVAVVIFGLAFFVAALVFRGGPGVLPLLIVPALPYLTVALSNYSLLNAAFVVMAAAVVLLAVDEDASPRAGVALGLASAVALATARSAAAAFPLLLACAAARFILPPSAPASRRGWIFWAGLAASVPLFVVLANGPYLNYLAELAHASTLATYGVLTLVFAALTALAMVDRRRQADSIDADRRAGGLLRAGCWVAAAIICAGIIASMFVTLPAVRFLGVGAPTAPGAYVLEVLKSAVFPFRVAQQDYMLSTTFWGSFGWMNLPLPDAVLGLLSSLTGLALTAQLVFCARRGSRRDCSWAIAILAGTFASLLVCAGLAVAAQADVHGRYTMGLYLPVLLYAFSGPAARTVPRGVTLAVPLVAAAVQAYALFFLAARYF